MTPSKKGGHKTTREKKGQNTFLLDKLKFFEKFKWLESREGKLSIELNLLQFLYPTDLLVDVSACKPLFKLPGLKHAWRLLEQNLGWTSAY